MSSWLSRPTSWRTCVLVKATEELLGPPPPNPLFSALPAVTVAASSVSAAERVGRQIACASGAHRDLTCVCADRDHKLRVGVVMRGGGVEDDRLRHVVGAAAAGGAGVGGPCWGVALR